jgi:hypothetical protein
MGSGNWLKSIIRTRKAKKDGSKKVKVKILWILMIPSGKTGAVVSFCNLFLHLCETGTFGYRKGKRVKGKLTHPWRIK